MDLATPAQDQRKSVGRLTRLVARSLSMVWQSARKPFVALIGLQILNAIALIFQVIAIELALKAVLSVTNSAGVSWSLVQPVLLLAGVTALTAVVASIQIGIGRFAGELVAAVMWQRVLHVVTRVDLRKFESTRFYDRLQRVQASALTRPYQITYGLVATIGAAIASIGLVVAIVLIYPALLPLLLIGGVPMLITSRRQSELEFDFLAQQTQSMRLRTYLTWVQTGRDEAKEVRAFGLARNFGKRLEILYADYLRDLAQHLLRRSRLGALGSLGSTVLLALTLLLLVWLISVGRLGIAEAAAALVAIRLLARFSTDLPGSRRSSNPDSSLMILMASSPWPRQLRVVPARAHRQRSFIAFARMPSASRIPVVARSRCRPPTSRSTAARLSLWLGRTAPARPRWPRSSLACMSRAVVPSDGMAPTYAASGRSYSESGSPSSSRTSSATRCPPRRTSPWPDPTTRLIMPRSARRPRSPMPTCFCLHCRPVTRRPCLAALLAAMSFPADSGRRWPSRGRSIVERHW